MASIKVVLDTRRMKQDRTYPVILRVINNGKSTSVSLGIYLFEKDWDDRKRQVRKSHPNAQLVNHRIIEAYHQLEAKILKADPDSPVSRFTSCTISAPHAPMMAMVFIWANDCDWSRAC